MTAEDSLERWRRIKEEREAERLARYEATKEGVRPDEIAPERLPTQGRLK